MDYCHVPNPSRGGTAGNPQPLPSPPAREVSLETVKLTLQGRSPAQTAAVLGGGVSGGFGMGTLPIMPWGAALDRALSRRWGDSLIPKPPRGGNAGDRHPTPQSTCPRGFAGMPVGCPLRTPPGGAGCPGGRQMRWVGLSRVELSPQAEELAAAAEVEAHRGERCEFFALLAILPAGLAHVPGEPFLHLGVGGLEVLEFARGEV